jgi:hypothetical protein
VVCTAALAGGAVEVNREITHRKPTHARAASVKPKKAHPAAPLAVKPHRASVPDQASAAAATGVSSLAPSKPLHKRAARKPKTAVEKPPAAPALQGGVTAPVSSDRPADDPSLATGGARAPDAAATATPAPTSDAPVTAPPSEPIATQPQPSPDPASEQTGAPGDTIAPTGAAPGPSATPVTGG